MTVARIVQWLCNCLCGGPTPAEDVTLACTNSRSGIDPFKGEQCTDVPIGDLDPQLPTDPPQCRGGDTDPCGSGHLWRAVFPCTVPGGCSAAEPMTVRTDADLPAPEGYEDCSKCFTMTVAGMGGGVGDISSTCCAELNGDWELCYRACESTSSVLVWRTDCITTVDRDSESCGPRHSQLYRSAWRLEYTVATTTWKLRSFNAVGHPIYTLVDATPCDGTPKELTAEDPSGSTGCISCPTTITITAGEDCDCTAASVAGCSVNLWRHCGETTYQYRSGQYGSVAEPDAWFDATLLPEDEGCCRTGYAYTGYEGEGSACCPQQKQDYWGRTDPWKKTTDKISIVWDLDPTSDPPTLTGDFLEGIVEYTGDTAMKCDGATHFTQISSTLTDGLTLPSTCCVVRDKVMTCNVVYEVLATAQQNAGHESHATFCASNDTCAPSIPGEIVVTDSNGNACGGGSPCFSRSALAVPRHADANTVFGRIGCIRLWNGQKENVFVQVVYPAGTAADPTRWGSDWYCSEGDIGVTQRQCETCEAHMGDFLGTTFANKLDCETFPFFPGPVDTRACYCAADAPVCCDNFASIFATMTSSCGKLSGTVELLNIGIQEWQGFHGALDPCGAAGGFYVTVTCVDGVWTIDIDGNLCTGGTSTTTEAACDPLDVVFEEFTMSCSSTDCGGTPTTDECDGATVNVTLGE